MKAVTKDRILQRAARLFFAEGFAVGIDRVTLEYDAAKMSIYGEFKSKDGLIDAIRQEVRRALAERIDQIIEPDLPAWERLQAVFNGDSEPDRCARAAARAGAGGRKADRHGQP